MKLNCHDWSGKVRYLRKMTQDNDVIDRIGVVYTENETELPWSIRQYVVYDEN